MQGVPQSPMYHVEGDVLTHTRMVATALTALEEWRALPEAERTLLFAAALLHDVGKPACTVIDEAGTILSRGHARKGEPIARRLLWTGEELMAPFPLVPRETIAGLVRLHGLPLQFLAQDVPERALISASQRIRMDHLAMLAEADVRGRICADQDELLIRVALFRELCQELECYRAPRSFATPHSRFVYFQHLKGDPNYQAYDTTKFEVTLLAGLPGTGKDTWLQGNRGDLPVISLDEIRKELRISPEETQGEVVQLAKERARRLMRQEQSFIWNATNVTKMMRQQLVELFVAYGARVRIVYLDAPLRTIFQRNRARQEYVPEHVIERLVDKLEPPDATEAHEVRWVSV
jgi:putative nucleotidyltransferase with HDIG domain